MSKVKHIFLKYRVIIFLSILFFVVRLYHLTAIPIFNDEAIYLDWGWRELHRTNNLFYSLYDAKPPFLMWLFGLASMIFSNPLFAGRFVSVLFGYITLLGVWKLTKSISSDRASSIASLLYIVIPIFSYFDRQALMESAIGGVGVWACYATLQIKETKKIRWAIVLGAILGIGYFIKSNTLIFAVLSVLLLGFDTIVRRKSLHGLAGRIFIIYFVSLFIVSSMLVQSQFWETLSTNARYVLTIREIFLFPWRHWILMLDQVLEIIIVYFTPLPAIFLFIALIRILVKKPRIYIFITIWCLLTLGFDILFARGMIERYVVSFLPPVIILIGITLDQIKNRIQRTVFIAMTVGTAFSVTVIQILFPISYFSLLSHVSQFALQEYTTGSTSGYGIPEAVQYLRQSIDSKPAYIATAIHTGNPESGIMTAFMKNENVYNSYLEATYIKDVDTYDCLSSTIPIYFVSREDDTAGLDRFLKRIYFVRNPVSGFGIGIYTLKDNCMGKTLQLIGQKT